MAQKTSQVTRVFLIMQIIFVILILQFNFVFIAAVVYIARGRSFILKMPFVIEL